MEYPSDPGMHNMGPGADGHTRVTYRRNATFFDRIGNSLVGIVIGFVLLAASSVLIFWNEGRAVQTAQSLDEGLRSIRSLNNIEVAFDENNGKLVHLSGPLHTDAALSDEFFGIAVRAVKLKRHVEMYQWVEHESKREFNEGGHTRVETSYSYTTEWKSIVVHSNSFDNRVGHHNPSSMSINSETFTADPVNVGNFILDKGFVGRISTYKDLVPKVDPNKPGVQLQMGAFYQSHNPQRPQVGDLRISFQYAGLSGDNSASIGPPDVVTLIGQQQGRLLTTYHTDAGDDLQLLYPGSLTAKQVFDQEHATNSMLTWGLRLAGWLLMFVAFTCITSILQVLVDWLPIIRELVSLGRTIVNLSLSISLSLTVIALGWIRYRPWLGLSILAMAATPFILAKLKSNKNERNRYA